CARWHHGSFDVW
nr:immunoglobulin heavy chain junction region [Macaca mulatta]MOW24022.1 immunoglobulin heavy chain junction region [Macaca mulatta]MOW25049.1 immunoglobulin heavy chain junction region [Macaca mulatta]